VDDSRPNPSSAAETHGSASSQQRAVRGSLLERIVRHRSGCPKCARGEGHRVFVLTVIYQGGRTRQLSVRWERVAEVGRWLDNYRKLKQAIEAICELNHELLRPEPRRRRSGGRHD
jgi:hypothetical protein